MEEDGQRLYSVLTRKEVRDKMMETVNHIAEIFALSKPDVLVILMQLKWNAFAAKVRLSGDREKLMEETGLADRSAFLYSCEHFVNPFEDLVKACTPYCRHYLCNMCWRDYLIDFMKENKEKEEERVMLLCPLPICSVPVGPDTIDDIKEIELKKIYERYVLEYYVECHKKRIKWCPQKGCNNAISLCEDVDIDIDNEFNGFDVTCLCGHIFCWRCKLESHRPVSCENASLWLNRHLKLAKWIGFNLRNNKLCPNCNKRVPRICDTDLSLITCTCSYRFCWRCFQSEEDHKGITKCVEVFNQPSSKYQKRKVFSMRINPEMEYLPEYRTLWDPIQKELEKDQTEVEYFEFMSRLNNNFGYNRQDVKAIREAFMMTIRCRLVQKWSIVYDSFIPEKQIAKNQYVTRLRGEATKTLNNHIESFKELVNRAVSSQDFSCFKLELTASTANTGKFFGDFVKNLEDGLPEVKDDDYAYENAPKSFWFWSCDGCTFQNTKFDKECKMCFAPIESSVPPPPVGSNIASSSKTNAHHQEAPNPRESDE